MPIARINRTGLDVVIVGGGLAGLAAAHELHANGLGVLVLEAADQLGGRARTSWLGGEAVDFGAQWLGRRHAHLLSLTAQLGVATKPARQLSRPILWRAPAASQRLVPSIPAHEVIAILRAIRSAGQLARPLSATDPWRSPHGLALDRMSFGEWLHQQKISHDGYYFFDKIIAALSSTPIDRLSLLHVLWWIRRGAGPIRTIHTTFERIIPSGAQAIATALGERLDGKVLTGTPVTAIHQTRSGVSVSTATGDTFEARRAVVAATFQALNRIAFDPALPPRLAALERLKTDPGTKIVAHLSGPNAPIHRMFVGGRALNAGWRFGNQLTGFAIPPASELPEDTLLADLAEGFNVSPSAFDTHAIYRWSDHPHIPGCDVGFAPGELTAHGPSLRAHHGLVHFAGAERSSWPNNMEGAVESGTATAHRILNRLRDPAPSSPQA